MVAVAVKHIINNLHITTKHINTKSEKETKCAVS